MSVAYALTPDEQAQAIRTRAARIRLARIDGAHFNEFVLKDEQTGGPIVMAPMHDEWHALADKHKRLIIWSHVEGGKTSQLSIGRVLFELGRDPTQRVVVLSNTHGQAEKVTRSVQTYIEQSEELREVFPHLKPASPWGAARFNVKRKVWSKDFSVQGTGAHGNIMGGRIDLLICDDVLDLENTQNSDQRERLIKWFLSTVVGRLTARSRVIIVGNAYHPKDLLHYLAGGGLYHHRTYPVANDNGEPRFPRQWTKGRIAAKRLELGPIEAARQLDCVARDESTARCKQEWVDACLARGLDQPLIYQLTPATIPAGAVAYTGVDLGVKAKQNSGRTVVFTILVHDNGDRQIVGITAGKIPATAILEAVADHQRRYGSLVHVEDNGAQDFLIQLAKEDNPDIAEHIFAFNTGANKTHPVFGVEGVFVEFARAAWIIPSVMRNGKPSPATEDIAELLSDSLNYSPNAHTGDFLMAAWIAKEGARKLPAPAEVGATVIGAEEPEITATPEERAADLEGWEAVMTKKRR